MANFIQQLNAGGVTYDLHDSEFIIDTRSASGAALTGTSKASALFDGMQITFWMNYAAASNATLNLTLADGTTTGAVPCYYNGTTRMGTQYAAGNVIRFTYRENVTIGSTSIAAGWWGDANYTVSDTNYDIFGTSLKVDTFIGAYGLCGITGTTGTITKQTRTYDAGTYWMLNGFTQTSGTGQTKKATTKGYYPNKIYYSTGSTALDTPGAATGTIAGGTNNVDLRYTVNGSSSANIGVVGAPFFLVGTIGNDGLFYLKGSQATDGWWTCGIPTTKQTDYVYWFVGVMSSKYQCRLSDRNWFIKWTGTGENDTLVYFEPWVSVDWSSISGKPSTFTPASHTHGYISNDGAVAPSVSASPASGDKILISDLTDSNKVKGGPEIGSNDGKYLRHDGVWDTPDDHILVMTGTPTGGLDSAPITTTTAWNDYIAAITNHDRLILDIPLARSRIEFQAQTNDGTSVNVLYAITNNSQRIVTSASYYAEEDANGFVVFAKDDSTASFSQFAGEADSADYVAWNNIGANPYPTTAPAGDGNYSLNVSGGTTSWTAASSGPNTPDAPATDGNYVLNVSSGSSSWEEEEKEVIWLSIYDRVYDSDWDGSYPRYRWVSSEADVTRAFSSASSPADIILSVTNMDFTDTYYLCNSFSLGLVFGYTFSNLVPSDIQISQLTYKYFGFVYVPSAYPAVSSSDNYVASGSKDLITASDFSSSSALSSASLSGGVTPTITYSAATASKAALTNGLLSFGDVSASNITNWSAGSMPTISTNTITVVTPASS